MTSIRVDQCVLGDGRTPLGRAQQRPKIDELGAFLDRDALEPPVDLLGPTLITSFRMLADSGRGIAGWTPDLGASPRIPTRKWFWAHGGSPREHQLPFLRTLLERFGGLVTEHDDLGRVGLMLANTSRRRAVQAFPSTCGNSSTGIRNEVHPPGAWISTLASSRREAASNAAPQCSACELPYRRILCRGGVGPTMQGDPHLT